MRYQEIMKLLDLVLTATLIFLLFWLIITHAKAETPLHGPHIARTSQQVEYYEMRGLRCKPEFLPGHVAFLCDN